MQQQNNSFMDSKTIFAVILVGIFWFGWQAYLQNKYPKPEEAVVATTENEVSKNTAAPQVTNERRETLQKLENEANVQAVDRPERLFQFESEKLKFQLSSKGMGLKRVVLPKYSTRDGEPIMLGKADSKALFESHILDEHSPLDFSIEQKNENTFVGVANHKEATITKTMVVDPELYLVDIRIEINSTDSAPGTSLFISDTIDEVEETGFFMASFGRQEVVLLHNGGEEERVNLSDLEEEYKDEYKQVSMASVGSQYFAAGVVDESVVAPILNVHAEPGIKEINASLDYVPASRLKKLDIKLKAYAGPKSVSLLEKVDDQFAAMVDYGMFSIIARPLLKVLRYFHGMVGNWGVAIILLTILVRLAVLPFNLMSFKSMKAMQRIQPQIQALREKYKEDPQSLNKEMMVLMKENKANPLGGCLPMLLQFPIFIALYQVLGQSIELYQAPFFAWIQDLSLKDPLYILPVLMGVSMFLQQKLTPTTMDPAQAKVMMIMPVVFALFMVALPSGLTLYIFVSTLFGIIQQFIFLREKNSQVKTQELKA